jgi:hypothetical protein
MTDKNPADIIKDQIECDQNTSYIHEPTAYITYCDSVYQIKRRPGGWAVFDLKAGHHLGVLKDFDFTRFFNDFMQQRVLSAFEIDNNNGQDIRRVREGREEEC